MSLLTPYLHLYNNKYIARIQPYYGRNVYSL